MKKIAKWVLIIWSILCLIFTCIYIAEVSQMFTQLQDEYELAGGTLGFGCGLGILLIIWLAVAAPATIIYLVSGKKEVTPVEIVREVQRPKLCPECGKYYEGNPTFCPNCGKPIKKFDNEVRSQ